MFLHKSLSKFVVLKDWRIFPICCPILLEFTVKEWNVPILVNFEGKFFPILCQLLSRLFKFAIKKWTVPILVPNCNHTHNLPHPKEKEKRRQTNTQM
jgi:hypothetical protein